MTIKGVVEKVAIKERTGSKGPYKTIAFLIDGEWHGGFMPRGGCDVQAGWTISFDLEQKGQYKNVVFPSLKVLSKDAPKAAPVAATGGKSYSEGARIGMSINNAVSALVHGYIKEEDVVSFANKVLAWSDAVERGDAPSANPAANAKPQSSTTNADVEDFDDDLPF